MKEKKFFEEVSKRCNYSDPELVRNVYLGLIKTIMHELRYNEEITLPHWGKFKTKQMKERKSTDVNTRIVRMFPAVRVISLIADRKLKEYIKKMN